MVPAEVARYAHNTRDDRRGSWNGIGPARMTVHDSRVDPRLWEKDYLFLRSLSQSLRSAIAQLPTYHNVLDIGSTWKPYRSLFSPSCQFFAADITDPPSTAMDYVIEGAHHMPMIADASFDVVLCTQVLEHVPDPAAVLAECARVLRPGGTLILSTHGVFHWHPYPYDYWRWTSEGLAKIIGEHFTRVEIYPNGGTMLLLCHIIGRGLMYGAERRWWLRWVQYTVYPLVNLTGVFLDRLLPDHSLSINYLAVARGREIVPRP